MEAKNRIARTARTADYLLLILQPPNRSKPRRLVSMNTRLLALLSDALGPAQAANEWRWMSRTRLPLHDMVARRIRGEPLQYILGSPPVLQSWCPCSQYLGSQPFGPLNLLVRPPVLIPRPETEHWVLRLAESFLPTLKAPVSLLDLGTGSGCIPLLLCHLWPPGSLSAHGVDISPHALRLAQDNAELCGIPSHLGVTKKPQNTFITSSANFLANDFTDAALSTYPRFDIITSNPPYIPWKEFLELPRSVIGFEDPRALFGGPSGLEFYRAISRLISNKDILNPGAIVALEVGHDQASAVQALMVNTGRFLRTEIWLDPWGKQRTVIAHM